jgi:hypothetical protein
MLKRSLVFAATMACSTIQPAHAAGISLLDVFKNVVYRQTSGVAPAVPASFFANVELTSQNAFDFTNVSVTYPGPSSPITLPQVSPTFFGTGPSFATQAAMNAAFPTGTYTYNATNSGTSFSQTASLNYTGDAFTSAIPALTASSFNALNGLNTGSSLTIGFNSFTPNPAASLGLGFFFISNASGTAFTDDSLAPSSTSLLLPANTLAPNTTYTFELDFSDRQNGTDATGVSTLIGSDVRTDGTFTTGPATPEPASLLLATSGLFALLAFRKRFA